MKFLFDYDGTLHDSLHIYAPAVRAAYDRLVKAGFAPPRMIMAQEARQWIRLSPNEMWKRLLPQLPTEIVQEAVKQVGQIMQAEIEAGQARLYAGVPELLIKLRQENRRLILLSNCPAAYLRAHRRHFHLEEYFDGLYCSEDFGYQPKQEIFRSIQREHAGEFVIVGDRRQDIKVAEMHGLESVGCRYGYGSAEELAGATYRVSDVRELERVLLQLSGRDCHSRYSKVSSASEASSV